MKGVVSLGLSSMILLGSVSNVTPVEAAPEEIGGFSASRFWDWITGRSPFAGVELDGPELRAKLVC